MAAIKFLPSDAVTKAYSTNTHHTTSLRDGNPFAQTREFGLWDFPAVDYLGTVNGAPATSYHFDEEGVYKEVERSMSFWS